MAARRPTKPRRPRRFGSVRQLPSGLWQARYRDPTTGALTAAPERFVQRRDADMWLDDMERTILRGSFVSPTAGKISVREWGARWYDSVEMSLKVKTQANYTGMLRTKINPHFGDAYLDAIRPIDVIEWVAKLRRQKSARTGRPLSPSQVRQAYRVFSMVMSSAVDNDLIPRTPCRGVKLPRERQTDPVILTPAEMDRIVACARPPHDVLIAILAHGGLRIGEAFALRRSSFNPATGRLLVAESVAEVSGHHHWDAPKNHRRRSVRLPDFVAARVAHHLRARPVPAETLMFVNRRGGVIFYNAWRKADFDPAVAAAGFVDVTPHDLRASHGSWVAENFGVMAAAKRLGHSNGSVTTRHYARARDTSDDVISAGLDADHEVSGGPDGMARTWHAEPDDGPGVPAVAP